MVGCCASHDEEEGNCFDGNGRRQNMHTTPSHSIQVRANRAVRGADEANCNPLHTAIPPAVHCENSPPPPPSRCPHQFRCSFHPSTGAIQTHHHTHSMLPHCVQWRHCLLKQRMVSRRQIKLQLESNNNANRPWKHTDPIHPPNFAQSVPSNYHFTTTFIHSIFIFLFPPIFINNITSSMCASANWFLSIASIGFFFFFVFPFKLCQWDDEMVFDLLMVGLW